MRQPSPGHEGAKPVGTADCYSNPGLTMAALIAIAVFIAAIFLLNVIEFGRPD